MQSPKIRASLIRTALVSYRSELLHLYTRYPEIYKEPDVANTVNEIDLALLCMEGNIDNVHITPATCKVNV